MPTIFQIPTQFAEQLADFTKKSGLYGRIRDCPAYRSTWPIYGETQRFPPSDAADPFWAPAREPNSIRFCLSAAQTSSPLVDIDTYIMPKILIFIGVCAIAVDCITLIRSWVTTGYTRPKAFGCLHSQWPHHGRQQSTCRSLARRRLDGRIDLETKETILEYRQAGAVDAIFRHASVHLDDNERHYLRIAIAGKLLELSAYRPYELELDDCRFIRDALNTSSLPRSGNLQRTEEVTSWSQAPIFRSGLFRHACTLTPPKLYFAATAG